VRQRLGRERIKAPVVAVAGQVGGPLAAPVEDEDGAAVKAGGVVGGGGVGQVMGDEADVVRVEAGQRGRQEARRPRRKGRPQPVPGVAGHLLADGQRGVVGVGDRVQARRLQPRLRQAPCRRLIGQLPGREGDRQLSVLAPAQPLLLDRRHGLAVEDQGGGRVVENRVDTEDSSHTSPP
jgi:hypothetical protein